MDDVSFFVMDKITLRKMENALMKILLLGPEHFQHDVECCSIGADSAMDAGSVQYRPAAWQPGKRRRHLR